MPLYASIRPVLSQCWQHWLKTGVMLAHNGMFTGQFMIGDENLTDLID